MLKKILFIFAVISITGISQAQNLMVGPQLGYFVPSEKNADGSFLFGGSARLKLGNFGIEGAINYRQESQDFLGGEITTSFYPVMVSGLIYIVPIAYATAGIGWYNYNVEFDFAGHKTDFSDSEIGYHVGGGAEIPLGNIVLSADIKYIFMKYQFEGSTEDLDADGFIINATVFFKL